MKDIVKSIKWKINSSIDRYFKFLPSTHKTIIFFHFLELSTSPRVGPNSYLKIILDLTDYVK